MITKTSIKNFTNSVVVLIGNNNEDKYAPKIIIETLNKLLSTKIRASNFFGCSSKRTAVLAPAPFNFSISLNSFGLNEKKETSEAEAIAEPANKTRIIKLTVKMVNVGEPALICKNVIDERVMSKI